MDIDGATLAVQATARPCPIQWLISNSWTMSSMLRFSLHSILDVREPMASAMIRRQGCVHIRMTWSKVDAAVYQYVAVWFSMAFALHAEGLWKLYESGDSVIQAVQDVSLSINQGSMVAIMGHLVVERRPYSTFFQELTNRILESLWSMKKISTVQVMMSVREYVESTWASFSKSSISFQS